MFTRIWKKKFNYQQTVSDLLLTRAPHRLYIAAFNSFLWPLKSRGCNSKALFQAHIHSRMRVSLLWFSWNEYLFLPIVMWDRERDKTLSIHMLNFSSLLDRVTLLNIRQQQFRIFVKCITSSLLPTLSAFRVQQVNFTFDLFMINFTPVTLQIPMKYWDSKAREQKFG